MPDKAPQKSIWQKLLEAFGNPSSGAASLPPPSPQAPLDTEVAGQIIHDRLDPKKHGQFNNPFKK